MGCLGMGQACAGGSPHTKGGKPWVCLAPLTPENNKKIIIKNKNPQEKANCCHGYAEWPFSASSSSLLSQG